ncbi:hypothetical protein PV328_012030 [Microctonus aethiopoides]|uniref:Uncharacterized protein n=1 Tax=Microctonus aethiopoides TaxID=144406 RepID=A0AA39C3M9_9HYME|nr:hypothetical protein PV328_012030 [Microctonus aethiopoides]
MTGELLEYISGDTIEEPHIRRCERAKPDYFISALKKFKHLRDATHRASPSPTNSSMNCALICATGAASTATLAFASSEIENRKISVNRMVGKSFDYKIFPVNTFTSN